MDGMVVVFGYGPVGRATTTALVERGVRVRVAQRTRPADLPPDAEFMACDVLDAAAVGRAVLGTSQIVVAYGFPYDGRVWRRLWPAAIRIMLDAASTQAARIVFVDNLYMYGPQHAALREDMPLTSVGVKPAVRAEVTRLWMAAAAAGRVRVAAVRAPDFYGPDVTLSHLGSAAFGAIGKGKTATLIVPADIPHDFAYVPDIARAVVTLLDAPDDAFGQAWHVPCAPIRMPREILQLGADALSLKLKLRSIPMGLLPLIGLVVPFMREVAEMRFTWDRPYHVDATKFARRFWSDPTPFEIGAPATARSFQVADRSSAPASSRAAA